MLSAGITRIAITDVLFRQTDFFHLVSGLDCAANELVAKQIGIAVFAG